jgi:hypothetical protein
VLTWRVVKQAVTRGRSLDRLSLALPLVVLLETVWSFGELVGYLTGRTCGSERSIKA